MSMEGPPSKPGTSIDEKTPSRPVVGHDAATAFSLGQGAEEVLAKRQEQLAALYHFTDRLFRAEGWRYTSWRLTRPSTGPCPSRTELLMSRGRNRQTDGSCSVGLTWVGRLSMRRPATALVHALSTA
jgi:hypothetical protein